MWGYAGSDEIVEMACEVCWPALEAGYVRGPRWAVEDAARAHEAETDHRCVEVVE